MYKRQPLSKISVRDIVEDCGINRNSFYYHFQDIPTLIGEIIKEEMDNIIASFPTVNRLDECVEAIFHIAYENKRAVRNIYNSVNRDIYEHSVMQLCEYLVETYFKTAFPETKLEGSEKELAVQMCIRDRAYRGHILPYQKGRIYHRCGRHSAYRLKLWLKPGFLLNMIELYFRKNGRRCV